MPAFPLSETKFVLQFGTGRKEKTAKGSSMYYMPTDKHRGGEREKDETKVSLYRHKCTQP